MLLLMPVLHYYYHSFRQFYHLCWSRLLLLLLLFDLVIVAIVLWRRHLQLADDGKDGIPGAVADAVAVRPGIVLLLRARAGRGKAVAAHVKILAHGAADARLLRNVRVAVVALKDAAALVRRENQGGIGAAGRCAAATAHWRGCCAGSGRCGGGRLGMIVVVGVGSIHGCWC